MRKNKGTEKEVLDSIKSSFIDFYNVLHEDEHASSFFVSFNQVESLIEKQSFFILNIVKTLEENKNEEAKKELYKLAKRHFDLGISPKALFDFIALYIDLLKKKMNIVNDNIINTIENMLKETTAKVYIKGYIDELIKSINREIVFRKINRYDDYFYERVNNHLRTLKELIDGSDKGFNNLSLFTHTACNVFKLAGGLAYKVMFYGKEEQLLEFKSLHKKLHEYTGQIVSYIVNGKYKESVILTSEMVSIVYKLINIYSDIALRWKDNKKTILYDYISSYENKLKTNLIVIETRKDVKVKDEIKKEVLKYLENYFTDFQFMFFDEIDETINVLVNQEDPYFNMKLDNLLKGFRELANYLKSRYVSLTENPVIKVGRIDLSSLKIYSLSKEEIYEIFNLIKDSLEKEKSDDVILVVDYNAQIKNIVGLAYENLEIKRVALSQLEKEEVDLFIHKIFDLNGREFGVEILARIKNTSDKNYIPAGKFINIFEREGVIGEFDRVVLKKLRENLKDIKKISNNIFVNIYPSSLSYIPVISELQQLISAFKEEKLNLFLEITEYALIVNKEILEYLENKDLFIVFDDFGKGYTNYELVG